MNKSKTSLFLMELIIVILFFSVSSVVCVQLFVNAHMTNQATTRLSNGNTVMTNLAECFIGCDADLSEIQGLYDYSKYDPELNTLTVFYNSEWNLCEDNEDVAYTASLYTYYDDNMAIGNITILDLEGNTIINEEIKHYLQYEMEVAQ